MSGNQITFSIKDGGVKVSRLTQYESRGVCALEMLQRMTAGWPDIFEGLSGSITYEDCPPAGPVPGPFAFCSTVVADGKGDWLPFPCPMALRWPEIGIPDAEAMIGAMLADDRPWESDKIFWIGTNQHPTRAALHQLGKTSPDVLDVEMMHWNRFNPKALVSRSRYVSVPDHRLFKYLADCPGKGYSARLKWLLATGRPVFVVSREVVEPWHLDLRPWEHYVPVKRDLSDLLDHHARLEADPGLAAEIGRNARRFATERLLVDRQLEQVVQAVLESGGKPFRFKQPL